MALPSQPDGANLGEYIIPILIGGKVCTTCPEYSEYIAETPNCSGIEPEARDDVTLLFSAKPALAAIVPVLRLATKPVVLP